MITSAAQDAAGVEMELLQNCGDVFEFVSHDPVDLRNAPRADVYVVDFGGLGSGFCTTMASLCVTQLQVMVEKHPGSLFLLWSAFTGRWYRDAIEDAAGDLVGESPLPGNVRVYASHSNEFWQAVRAWLGIEHVPESTPELEAKINDALRRHDAQDVTEDSTTAAEKAADEQSQIAAENDSADVSDELLPESVPTLEEVLAVPMPEYAVNPRYVRTDDGKPEYGDAVGELRIPLRISHRPGLKMGFARFKFADCVVDISDDDERRCGTIGGEMAGYYSFSFPLAGHPGKLVSYMLTPHDLWRAILPLHAEYVRRHIQDPEPPATST
jgi:hypothetical protein